MKVSKVKAAENRATLVAVASRRLREGGFEAMATSEIAKAAALTHGALYSHFKSKEALAEEALRAAFDQCYEAFDGLDAATWLDQYLSVSHRDAPGDGCPTAALMSEVPHQSGRLQDQFATGAEAFIALAGTAFQADEVDTGTQDRAMLMIAAMTGALALARATKSSNPALSEAVLNAVKRSLETL